MHVAWIPTPILIPHDVCLPNFWSSQEPRCFIPYQQRQSPIPIYPLSVTSQSSNTRQQQHQQQSMPAMNYIHDIRSQGSSQNVSVSVSAQQSTIGTNGNNKQLFQSSYIYDKMMMNNENSSDTKDGGAKWQGGNNRSNDELKASIQLFIQQMESKAGEQSISAPSQALGIKRRRLYDVVNVFESIGCCRKCGLDSVVWIGKENIKSTFEYITKARHIDDMSKTIIDLFPVHQCIGISNLTTSFILLYFALKTDHLDLRFVAQFFSRNTSRYKTTLCKLYQVSYILAAFGLTKRTAQVCEVVIQPEIFGLAVLKNEEKSIAISIQSLLNDKNGDDANAIMCRRKNYESFYLDHLKA